MEPKFVQKAIKKSIQKAIKNKIQFGIDFGWLLDRFWYDFGCQVEAKLAPSWVQKSVQEEFESNVKKRYKKDGEGQPHLAGPRISATPNPYLSD